MTGQQSPTSPPTYFISPDSVHVVYTADQNTGGVVEVFGARIEDGSRRHLRPATPPPAIQLSGPLVSGGAAAFVGITADSRTLVYRADAETDEQYELYSVPLQGGAPPLRLNEPLMEGDDVTRPVVAGARVVYLGPQGENTGNGIGLFGVPADGSGEPVALNPMLGSQVLGDVVRREITPDGRRTVYLADQETDFIFELYSAPTQGGTTPTKLHGDLATSAQVFDFRITPAGSQVVYKGGGPLSVLRDLWRVPVQGGETPLQLTSGGGVVDFELSPDGMHAVYNTNSLGDGDVRSVRIDGTGSSIRLNGSTFNGFSSSFLISPDSTRVVFCADELVAGRRDLFSVPIDGSSNRVRLNQALEDDRDATLYAISPDGTQVVYLVDALALDVYDIYSVPIDRSTAPVQLNATTNPDRDVTFLVISPDSTRVAFVSDQDTEGVFELYGVPIDGSSSAVRLHDPSVPNGDVLTSAFFSTPPAFTPDSSRVVYLANQETNLVVELFSADPAGGGSVKLNDPIDDFGRVERFAIGQQGRHVVYTANQDSPSEIELYRASITGHRPPVKLSGAMAPGGEVGQFGVQAGQVLYVADQETPELLELYRVPLAQNGEIEKLSGAMRGSGNSLSFTISPASNRVVYRADQDLPTVFELYSSPLRSRPLESATPTEMVFR